MGDSVVVKLWPWSKGAPVSDEHNELEEEMGPDPEEESEVYDFQQHPSGAKHDAGDETATGDGVNEQRRDD